MQTRGMKREYRRGSQSRETEAVKESDAEQCEVEYGARWTRTGRWSWNTDGKMVVEHGREDGRGHGREDDSWTRTGR